MHKNFFNAESFFLHIYMSNTQQVCMLLLTRKKIVYHVHKILKNRKIEKCEICRKMSKNLKSTKKLTR